MGRLATPGSRLMIDMPLNMSLVPLRPPAEVCDMTEIHRVDVDDVTELESVDT